MVIPVGVSCACYPARPWRQPPTRWCGRRPDRSPTGGTAATAIGCLAIVVICAALGYWRLPHTCRRRRRRRSGRPAHLRRADRRASAASGLSSLDSCSAATAAAPGRAAPARRPGAHRRRRPRTASRSSPPAPSAPTGRSTSPLGGVPCAAYDYRMFRPRADREGQARTRCRCTGATPAQPVRHRLARRARYPVASGTVLHAGKATPLTGDAAVARARALRPIDRLGDGGVPDARRARHRPPAGRRGLGDGRAHATSRLAYDDAPDVALLHARGNACCRSARRCRRSAPGRRRSARSSRRRRRCRARASSSPRGGPEALDGQPGVPQSTTSYIVGAIVLLALAAGLFWFARCSSRPSAETPRSRRSAPERRVDQRVGRRRRRQDADPRRQRAATARPAPAARRRSSCGRWSRARPGRARRRTSPRPAAAPRRSSRAPDRSRSRRDRPPSAPPRRRPARAPPAPTRRRGRGRRARRRARPAAWRTRSPSARRRRAPRTRSGCSRCCSRSRSRRS